MRFRSTTPAAAAVSAAQLAAAAGHPGARVDAPHLAAHTDQQPTRRRGRRIRYAVGMLGVAAAATGLLAVSTGPASASTAFAGHLTPNNTFGLLLDVSGASTTPGAQVIDWWANGGANQAWTFLPVGSSVYEIVNQNSGQCLTTDGVAGDSVVQMPCSGSQIQQWATSLTPSAFGAYTIRNPYSGLYLDVNGDSPWPGAALDVWYYNGGQNQYFALV